MADLKAAGEIDLGAIHSDVEEARGDATWCQAIICGVFPELPENIQQPYGTLGPAVAPVGVCRRIVERIAVSLNELLQRDPDAILSLLSVRVPAGAYLQASRFYLCDLTRYSSKDQQIGVRPVMGVLGLLTGLLQSAGLPMLAGARDVKTGVVTGVDVIDSGVLVHSEEEVARLLSLPDEQRVYVSVIPAGIPPSGVMLWDRGLPVRDFVGNWATAAFRATGQEPTFVTWEATDPAGVAVGSGSLYWDSCDGTWESA